MRFQKVSVDVWKVIFTSGSCLFLAFMAWVFLKLAYACVWLPGYLQKQQTQGEDSLDEHEAHTHEKDQQLKKNE